MTHPCSKSDDIAAIREDVSYIKGKVDGLASQENRIQGLERNQRAQNFLGALIAGVLGWLQIKGGGGV